MVKDGMLTVSKSEELNVIQVIKANKALVMQFTNILKQNKIIKM